MADEYEAMQSRLEMLDEIYQAETEINEGRDIPHEEVKAILLDSHKS